MNAAQPGRPSRRGEFLERVIQRLMTSGINDVSLRELAAEVGTSHRVLIYHFGTKENLVNEVVQEIRRREKDLFRRTRAETSRDLAAQLMTFFDHNVSPGMRSYFRLFYEVWGIALSKPEVYERFLDGIVSVWVDSLAEILTGAGYPAELAVPRATLVLAALRGLQLDLFTTAEEQRVRAAYAALVDLILGETHRLALKPLAPEGTPESQDPENGNPS